MFLVCIYAVASDLCGYLLVYLAKKLYFSIVNSIEMYEGWLTQTLSVDQHVEFAWSTLDMWHSQFAWILVGMTGFRQADRTFTVINNTVGSLWNPLFSYKLHARLVD